MYLVWKKDPYSDTWARHGCETGRQLQETILELLKSEGEVQVTSPLDYKIDIQVQPPKNGEKPTSAKKLGKSDKPSQEEGNNAASESETERDQSPGS